MMHKLTLITYLITPLLKNTCHKNYQIFILCIPQETVILLPVISLFEPNFQLVFRNYRLNETCRKWFLTYPGTEREKISKIIIFGHFSSHRPL